MNVWINCKTCVGHTIQPYQSGFCGVLKERLGNGLCFVNIHIVVCLSYNMRRNTGYSHGSYLKLLEADDTDKTNIYYSMSHQTGLKKHSKVCTEAMDWASKLYMDHSWIRSIVSSCFFCTIFLFIHLCLLYSQQAFYQVF